MQRLVFDQDYALPVERVFTYLAEHENLAAVFGTRVERVRDGDSERNGVGSVRKLSFNGLLPFEETVTEFIPDALIRYRITKGSPLRDHEGEMTFTAREGGGTHLHYVIVFRAPVPGLAAVIGLGLKRNVAAGLAKVDAAA